jgi:hypothetical protein
MESVVSNVNHSFSALESEYIELCKRIREPFEEMKSQSKEINRLVTTIETLRLVSRFLEVYERLDLVMSDSEELPRAATYCYDLDVIVTDPSFQICPIVEDEHAKYVKFKGELTKKGFEWIHEGLQQDNQVVLAKSFQIFQNLRNLGETVCIIISEYESTLEKLCIANFDTVSLNLEMKGIPLLKKSLGKKENLQLYLEKTGFYNGPIFCGRVPKF